MATDSLSSEMDKMDVQGMRNPHVCSSAVSSFVAQCALC